MRRVPVHRRVVATNGADGGNRQSMPARHHHPCQRAVQSVAQSLQPPHAGSWRAHAGNTILLMRIGGIGVVKTGVSGSLHLLEDRLKAAFQQNFQTILGIFEYGNTKNSSRKSDSRIRYVRHNGFSDINIRPTTAVLNKLQVML